MPESGRSMVSVAAVAKALDDLWDPIGLYDETQDERPASGEYERYAGRILGALEGGDDAASIASLLAQIECDEMGLPSSGRELLVADALIAWYRRQSR